MKHKSLYLILGVIFLCTAGLYFLFRDDGLSFSGGANTLLEFRDIGMIEEKDGVLVWKLKADNVKMKRDRNTAYLEGVEVYFSSDGNEVTVLADTGVLNRKEESIRLEGHIKAKTKEGASLEAKNLYYDGKKGILYTDNFFTFEKDGRVLSADSFTADRVLETLTAKGHAKLADKEDE